MIHDTQLLHRLSQIRLVILDVDGVLTDGGIYLGATEEFKRFDVQDGAGIVYLLRAGLELVVITGRESACVERRCRELNVTELHQGAVNKSKVFEDVLRRRKKSLAQTAVMGDDLADLPMMMQAGISAAPANATREVRVRASIVTHASGGAGAVREFAELILKAQDKWHDILEDYLE